MNQNSIRATICQAQSNWCRLAIANLCSSRIINVCHRIVCVTTPIRPYAVNGEQHDFSGNARKLVIVRLSSVCDTTTDCLSAKNLLNGMTGAECQPQYNTNH